MREIREIDDLFDVLCQDNIDYNNVKYTEDFLEKVYYYFKIEGRLKETNEEIKGTTTADILYNFIEIQKIINNLVAYHKKNKNNSNTLTFEERRQFTLLFNIKEGSVETTIENIKIIVKTIADMPMEVSLPIFGVLVIVLGGYFFYKVKDSNNKKEQFLAKNEFDKQLVNNYKEVCLKALNSDKLELTRITTANKNVFTQQEVKDMYDNIEDKENIFLVEEEKEMYVKKLENKQNGNKIAVLSNNNITINVILTDNLFQKKQEKIMMSFIKMNKIKCKLLLEKNIDNGIVKATLIDIQD